MGGSAEPRDSAAVATKRRAWRQQSDALDAPAYRITFTSRRDNLNSFNYGKGRGPDGGEQFYTRDRIDELIPYLSRQNVRGYDVYVTPIDPDHHYLVVDDMTADTRAALERDGYRPALVQESSANNQQAVIKSPKAERQDEQSRANDLVQQLNQEHGDPEFSGVVHPFRMAGFSNKKPSKSNAFTRIVEAAGGICRRATEALQAIRDRHDQRAVERERATERAARKYSIQHERESNDSNDEAPAAAEMRREMKRILRMVKDKGWVEDWSRIDYRACIAMLSFGYDRDEIGAALNAVSPNIEQRHPHNTDYITRTLDAAERYRAERVAQQQQEPEPERPSGQGQKMKM